MWNVEVKALTERRVANLMCLVKEKILPHILLAKAEVDPL